MKILKNIIRLFILVIIMASCGTSKKKNMMNPNFSYFGEFVEPNAYIGFDDMMKVLEKTGTFTGKVKGIVTGVCQKKGCWMQLGSNSSEKELFVKFKDYGFFMPFDLAGKEVVVEGIAAMETTSVQMLKHYAMDAGASDEEIAQITQPETEFNFVSTGVVVLSK